MTHPRHPTQHPGQHVFDYQGYRLCYVRKFDRESDISWIEFDVVGLYRIGDQANNHNLFDGLPHREARITWHWLSSEPLTFVIELLLYESGAMKADGLQPTQTFADFLKIMDSTVQDQNQTDSLNTSERTLQ